MADERYTPKLLCARGKRRIKVRHLKSSKELVHTMIMEPDFIHPGHIAKAMDQFIENLEPLKDYEEVEDEIKFLAEMRDLYQKVSEAWGSLLDDFRAYTRFILELMEKQPQEWQDAHHPAICISITKKYIEKYDITTSTQELSGEEKERLRAFFLDYISQPDAASKRKAAQEAGALIDIGDIALLITDKNFRYALSPYRNETAYIEQLNDEFIQQLEFDKESGRISVKGQQYSMTIQELKTKRTLSELDLPLLRSIYTALYKTQTEIDTDTVTVYLPAFTKHMGIRIDTGKPNDMFAKIRSFDGCIGIMKDGRHHSFYRLLSLIKYDARANTMTFASPYMNRIYWAIKEQNTGKKNKTKELPAYSFLVHGDIASERNKKAVEIVAAIVTLIQQRGEQKPEEEKAVTAKQLKKTVTQAVNASFTLNATEQEETVKTKAHIKYRTLIETIPSLCEQLERTKTASAKNTILQRAFSKAFELLHTKTDLFTTYKNLRIDESIPTMSLLDETLCITHEGRIKKP